MRIACVYLPSFPLQVHVRRAPHLGGELLAVASETDHPVVISVSRAAREAGVRSGMTASRARQLCPGIVIRTASSKLYRQAAAAVADSLMALSSTVDRGTDADDLAANRALYLYVPTGTRGASFGDKVLTRLARQGLRGRIGIADDRFSAWVAASIAPGERADGSGVALPFSQTTTSVPRGGSAAFLAPLSLGLLPLDPDVLSMLRSLGINTLGDFASLPPPSMGRRWNERGVDLRTLASGDDPTELLDTPLREPVTEQLELEQPITAAEPLAFVLRPLLDRICDRLRGRGGAADRLAVRMFSHDDVVEPVIVPLDQPSVAGAELAAATRNELARRPLGASVSVVEISVLREVELEAAGAGDDLDRGQLSLSPLMRPTRESHRRTMRGQRGKKHRRRRRTGDRIRGLFE